MKPKKKLKLVKIDEHVIEKMIDDYNSILNKEFIKYIRMMEYEKKKLIMTLKVIQNRNDIWCPSLDINYHDLKMNTWFTIQESETFNTQFKNSNYDVLDKDDIKYKSKKVKLNLTKEQKKIINKWLNIYAEMYNIALKYIKDNIDFDDKVLNFFYMRSKLLKEKNELTEGSTIKVHDIDYAIKLACKNYKTALTNLKRGHIKHFRIRYWRQNKLIKMMELEKLNFKSGSMRKKVLGVVKGFYNGKQFNFNTIKCDCTLQKNKNEYYLYVPEMAAPYETNNKKNKQTTLDQGIRRFATGITENKVIKIGEDAGNIIKKHLLRKDKILKNKNISKQIKKKNEMMINKKISNLVDEMHWKTINYLVKNNETVLIGNMSSKSIVSKNGNLTKITKRIGLSLSFYKFHQRLQYKCHLNDVRIGKINEWMTSKMCSLCGSIDDKLGSAKVYNCKNCDVKIDRDVNGTRNIYIVAEK